MIIWFVFGANNDLFICATRALVKFTQMLLWATVVKEMAVKLENNGQT